MLSTKQKGFIQELIEHCGIHKIDLRESDFNKLVNDGVLVNHVDLYHVKLEHLLKIPKMKQARAEAILVAINTARETIKEAIKPVAA